jgi:hypothetical protein
LISLLLRASLQQRRRTTRSQQNAASIAGILLTTEAMLVEFPEQKAAAPTGSYNGVDGGY